MQNACFLSFSGLSKKALAFYRAEKIYSISAKSFQIMVQFWTFLTSCVFFQFLAVFYGLNFRLTSNRFVFFCLFSLKSFKNVVIIFDISDNVLFGSIL